MCKPFVPLGAALLLAVTAAPLRAGPHELKTVEQSTETVRALCEIPLRGIPHALLRDAKGVAIIPGVVKVGFVVGARAGHGVVLARQPDGTWSNPVFITLVGGGVGWQVGIQSTDVVLVFRSAQSMERFLKGKGKITLGGDVSIAAGPVGREAEAAIDARLKAEIVSYSRSRGLFAGLSLEGAGLLVNHKANDAFYGLRGSRPADVLALQEKIAAAETLKGLLTRLGAPPEAPPVIVPAPLPSGPPPVIVPAPPAVGPPPVVVPGPVPTGPPPVIVPPPGPPSPERWPFWNSPN
jgi:lipid-binding SYLF domain-containing protein